MAEGMCVVDRKGGVPAYVRKEVHVAAVVIVLIKEYFPEFLLWHLRALPRMPFLKLLFDFQGRCSTHTHSWPHLVHANSQSHQHMAPFPFADREGGGGGRMRGLK